MKLMVDEVTRWDLLEICDNRIIIDTNLSGKERQKIIGLALTKLLLTERKIFGTKRINKSCYEIYPEKVNLSIVERFINMDWLICSSQANRCVGKRDLYKLLNIDQG